MSTKTLFNYMAMCRNLHMKPTFLGLKVFNRVISIHEGREQI